MIEKGYFYKGNVIDLKLENLGRENEELKKRDSMDEASDDEALFVSL